jgi:large subunit ribosomal protein L4
LSYKASENSILVVEDFTFEAPKTKDFIKFAKNIKVSDKKLLLVLPESNNNVYLSARNLQKTQVISVSGVNTYRVMNAGVLVLTEKSLNAIGDILIKKEA